MKKIKSSYVEKIYPGIFFNESSFERVDKRDPFEIENDQEMQGFRFFDRDYIIDGDDKYEGKAYNYSNWYLFGERLSLSDVINKYGTNYKYKNLINNMISNDWEYICLTQTNNFILLEENDITMDELKQNKKLTLKKD